MVIEEQNVLIKQLKQKNFHKNNFKKLYKKRLKKSSIEIIENKKEK